MEKLERIGLGLVFLVLFVEVFVVTFLFLKLLGIERVESYIMALVMSLALVYPTYLYEKQEIEGGD